MEHIFHIKTVADYFKWRSSKPAHPLVGILSYENTQALPDNSYDGLHFECYAVL